MPTIYPKVLANGVLANTKGTIYTVPTGRIAYVKFLRITNTNAGSVQTGKIFVNLTSTSREIGNFVLAALETADILDNSSLTLEEGDTIEGWATDASISPSYNVDYVITGAEQV